MAELKRFLVRRLLTFIPTIIGVTLITFLIAYVVPADPARAWAGGEKASPKAVELVKERYHLNDPWYVQYAFLVQGLFTGTLINPQTQNPVTYDLMKYFPNTLELAVFAFIFILLLGIPLGFISAIKKDTVLDMGVRVFALIGVSTPIFWLGYILIWVFFVNLRIITIAGVPPPPEITVTGLPVLDALLQGDFTLFWQHVQRFWLPGFVLGFMGAGVVARFVRNSLLESLGSDYIEYLKAKGVSKLTLWRHALKNALVPIVTVLGLQFGALLSGAPITEIIFGIPGIGRYAVLAIQNLNFPAIIGVTFMFAMVYVTANLIVDILYAIIDPRVRY